MQGRSPNLRTDLDRVTLIAFNTYNLTVTGTGIDVSKRCGIGIVQLKAADIIGGTSPTLNVALQSSTDDAVDDAYAAMNDADGNTLAFTEVDASNTAAIQDQEKFIDLDNCERYIRAVGTIAGAQSGSVPFGVSLLCVPKTQPGSKTTS